MSSKGYSVENALKKAKIELKLPEDFITGWYLTTTTNTDTEKSRLIITLKGNEILIDLNLNWLITQYKLDNEIKNEIKKYIRNKNIEKIIN